MTPHEQSQQLEEAARATARAERRARRRTLLAAAWLIVLLLIGSGGAWYAEYRASLRRDVTHELDVANAYLLEGRLTDARNALGRAETLLRLGGSDDLRKRLDEAKVWLERADELERIRQERWSIVDGKFPKTGAVSRYAASFAEFGLEVEKVE